MEQTRTAKRIQRGTSFFGFFLPLLLRLLLCIAALAFTAAKNILFIVGMLFITVFY